MLSPDEDVALRYAKPVSTERCQPCHREVYHRDSVVEKVADVVVEDVAKDERIVVNKNVAIVFLEGLCGESVAEIFAALQRMCRPQPRHIRVSILR